MKRLYKKIAFFQVFAMLVSLLSGVSMLGQVRSAQADEHTLAAPRIEADETAEDVQVVTWDSVWFGSYPQAEVVSAEMKEGSPSVGDAYYEEDDLIVSDDLYHALSEVTDWDKNGDAIYNGNKYRRIKQSDANYSSGDGSACYYKWQNEEDYHYFQYQPIKWRVLNVNGDFALLMAENALDCKEYNSNEVDMQWGKSTIRSWLNGYGATENNAKIDFSADGFLGTAFSKEEQGAIGRTSTGEMSGSADEAIWDKVFLLSDSEMIADSFGFLPIDDTYDSARQAKGSMFAKAMGTWWNTDHSYAGHSDWWLSTTIIDTSKEDMPFSALTVDSYGGSGNPIYVHAIDVGVRPFIHVSLASDKLEYAGTVRVRRTVDPSEITTTSAPVDLPTVQPATDDADEYAWEDIAAPRVVSRSSTGSDSSVASEKWIDYDCIWFGEYPQAEVVSQAIGAAYKSVGEKYRTGNDLIISDSIYQGLEEADSWSEDGDIVYNGQKYRRIREKDASYSRTGSDNQYNWADGREYHYFQYQPVKWRVLSKDGKNVLLLADQALDSRNYNETYEDVVWKDSTIRSWLNGYDGKKNTCNIDYSVKSFYGDLFTEKEQAAILSSNIINADNHNFGTEGGVDTEDRVFLLSEDEVYGTSQSQNHGFAEAFSTDDEARRSLSSAYAKAMGAWWNKTDSYAGKCWWWLRSPGESRSDAGVVYDSGWVSRGGFRVNTAYYAVRPAVRLSLESGDIWGYAGTVSSNGSSKEIAANIKDRGETVVSVPTAAPVQSATAVPASEYSEGPSLAPVITSSPDILLPEVSPSSSALPGGESIVTNSPEDSGTTVVTTAPATINPVVTISPAPVSMPPSGMTASPSGISTASPSGLTTPTPLGPVTLPPSSLAPTPPLGPMDMPSSGDVAGSPLGQASTAPPVITVFPAGTLPSVAPVTNVSPVPVVPSSGTPTAAPTASPKLKSPAKGDMVEFSSGNIYTVLSYESTVAFTVPGDDKATSYVIPANVKINGIIYQVTGISESAFEGITSLKKVTIGKNVRSIGKKAFYGCKNLKTIIIKTASLKASKVGKKSFAKIHASAVATVPKSRKKTYPKILKKRGMNGKNQKIKG